jgi:hypothetical protein
MAASTLPTLGASKSVPNLGTTAVAKMRKMTETDQGCFMMVSESVHPQLRLAFPTTSKILSGLTAWIVNLCMASSSINEALVQIFGETEMHAHAAQNVEAVATVSQYPGNLFLLLDYIPAEDMIIKYQIAVVVEYVMTEVLAMAGAAAMRLKDQDQFQIVEGERSKYEDFPKIRPSDVKAAILADSDLKAAFGSLFK